MATTGSVSLKILGEVLNFDEITNKIKINPTNVYKKGVIYNKIIGKTENDVWYYNIDFYEDDKLNDVVKQLIDMLNLSKNYIAELLNNVYVRIRIALQTEMAQIYFELSPDVISELSKLNIGLEFSVLSWGEVEK